MFDFFERLKYSNYPLWYDLTLGLWYDSKLYFHLYYKHTKKHKAELKAIHDNIMEVRKKAIGR